MEKCNNTYPPHEQVCTLKASFQAEDKKFNQTLGIQLRKRKNTPFGAKNLRLVHGEKDTHAKLPTWYVVAGTWKKEEKVPATESAEAKHAYNGATSGADVFSEADEHNPIAGTAETYITQARMEKHFFTSANEYTNEKEKNVSRNGNDPAVPPQSPQPIQGNKGQNGATSGVNAFSEAAGTFAEKEKSPQSESSVSSDREVIEL